MKNVWKKAGLFLLGMALLLLLLWGAFAWKTGYRPTEVVREGAPDGAHELIVYMVGEPDFPFGPTHARLVLTENGRKLAGRDIVILNDGGNASADDFAVRWESESVTVTVSGEEQEDERYRLGFDGSVSYETDIR